MAEKARFVYVYSNVPQFKSGSGSNSGSTSAGSAEKRREFSAAQYVIRLPPGDEVMGLQVGSSTKSANSMFPHV